MSNEIQHWSHKSELLSSDAQCYDYYRWHWLKSLQYVVWCCRFYAVLIEVFSTFWTLLFACNILTHSYIWSSGFTLSNTCSELYLVQFGNLASACRTQVFYRRSVESFLTGSSAFHKTLTLRTHTDNIACWVTCFSRSLWSVHYSLWSLSLCSLPPSPVPVQPHVQTMQQPVIPTISTHTQDPTVNFNCH